MRGMTPDWKRTESGLWIPDPKKSGLQVIKDIPETIDPKEYAKSSCKYCHGKGEMKHKPPGSFTSQWSLCVCVVKRFPRGKENTDRLKETEKKLRERKKKK